MVCSEHVAYDGAVFVARMAEVATGCEVKNRYNVHSWSPQEPDNVGPQIMYVREESDGFERICCKQNRRCVLYVHEGHDQNGNVIIQL